jgi:hypothetical protein
MPSSEPDIALPRTGGTYLNSVMLDASWAIPGCRTSIHPQMDMLATRGLLLATIVFSPPRITRSIGYGVHHKYPYIHLHSDTTRTVTGAYLSCIMHLCYLTAAYTLNHSFFTYCPPTMKVIFLMRFSAPLRCHYILTSSDHTALTPIHIVNNVKYIAMAKNKHFSSHPR